MGELKKYLQQHKEEMSFDEPGPLLWEKIAAPPAKKQPGRLVKFTVRFAVAAVILVMLLAGIRFLTSEKTQEKIEPVAIKKQAPADTIPQPSTPAIAEIKDTVKPAPALAVVKAKKKPDERYALMKSFKESYGELVNYQLQNIRTTPVYAENPAYFNDFKTRLRQMDTDEAAIRTNIRQNGISNTLIEQLINVYQQKLDVLKSLQQEINKMNTRVQQENPADSLNKYYLNI
ncbi:hypothetical protein [Ferruginibacter sp. HRS2-29]|uniref:hypothetical protein n=1 Tax=Ferruginibacter sp. HRS2-29 TaxID=2487334 RepID=UPI0020CBF68F|nr:hypothetical protein [Ferruginibacter sp. HRS2-29]MCP9751283.1 hypothetical protein [Ferruginibacter sp. HRS2-29]